MATKTQMIATRLGRNLGGYFGEGLEIASVLNEVRSLGLRHGWKEEKHLAENGVELLFLRRCAVAGTRPWNIYISAGIHGDEPAGPLAIRELLQAEWPDCANVWLCPCLNPTGFPLNTRESAAAVDLNRDYRDLRTPEARAHVAWLDQQPNFDLTLCLHEDWEAHGFYVYELNPDQQPSFAEAIVAGASEVCPVDQNALIDGREAVGGIIRPRVDPAQRPDWPEAFYLITRKARLCYTLESPSDFPLKVRVAALVAGTRAAVNAACKAGTDRPGGGLLAL